YHDVRLPETLGLRADCLRLVVPPDAVITDRSAAWLHGAPGALAPNSHVRIPEVEVFRSPGYRLKRHGSARSGERSLDPRDVTVVEGLKVTTTLRTACDVGRLLHRDQALAAMDALHSLGLFGIGELIAELRRFRGFRGIVQCRVLAPLVDGRAQSPGESAARLRWLDAGLPRPELQVPLTGPAGFDLYVDLGLPCCGLGVEYDGHAFHGDDRTDHDQTRRRWLLQAHGWRIVVLRRQNVFGLRQDAIELIRKAARDNPNSCLAHRFSPELATNRRIDR
ncbi:MAG: type IV toxin-antitoxin system AbiEi family antitoxin domain-containing protein, partial [Nocardioides sp.]